MTVYVLNRGYEYEGEVTLGVYADSESAVAAAKKDAIEYGHMESGDCLKLWTPKAGSDPYWASSEQSSSTWYIREFEVSGAKDLLEAR